MLLSYIVYFGLLIECWIFSYFAEKRNRKLLIWVITLSLTMAAGLRAYSVGLDTPSYVEKFSYIYKGMFSYAYGLEESFKYICYGILHVIPNASFLLGLLALITHACIILRFWELRGIASFPCMVVFYYMSFYFMSLNGIRQFVAVAIVFWGTRYLGQKKFLRFILCICIAALFHQTAIVGFLLLLLNAFQWKELQQKQKLLYILFILCVPLIIVLLSNKMAQYSRYFSDLSINIGLIGKACTMDVVYAVNGAQCNVSGIPVIHPCFRKIRRAHIVHNLSFWAFARLIGILLPDFYRTHQLVLLCL